MFPTLLAFRKIATYTLCSLRPISVTNWEPKYIDLALYAIGVNCISGEGNIMNKIYQSDHLTSFVKRYTCI